MKYLIAFCFIAITSCNNKLYKKNKKEFNLFFIGDSITSDDPHNISLDSVSKSKSWPWQMKNFLNSTKYKFRNHAVSGVGIKEMREQAKLIITERDSTKNNIVFILGAINDISNFGISGIKNYNNIYQLHQLLRSNGFKTVSITLTSRRQNPPFTEEESLITWSHIDSFNNLLLKNWQQFSDVLIDLQSETYNVNSKTGWGGYETANQSIFFLDGCHWSEAGKKWMAEKYAIPALYNLTKKRSVVISRKLK